MTRKLTLYYQIMRDKVYPPSKKMLEMKKEWIEAVKRSVESDHDFKTINVTYEVVNEEVRKMQKFLAVAVKYYAIQNDDILEGDIDSKRLKLYREEILDELLGYDVHLVNKVVRKRKSTTEFRTAQAWNNFFELMREALFEPSGYIFPDSKEYWDLVEKYGEEQANRIELQKLQKVIRKKYERQGIL